MNLKIAFASNDRKQVNQHFGAAEAFAIYQVDTGGAQLVTVAQFSMDDTLMNGQEGKLSGKIALLEGCAAIYCNAVGASAIQQLLAAGIQPLKVAEGTPIDQLLEGLNHALAQAPPAWMTRYLQGRDAHRFAIMDAEGWQE